MTKQISFTKMHGAGNDYIYIDTSRFPIEHPEEVAVRLSAYHTGIGSDGLVLIGTSPRADFSMRIFNADGSEALMCGNASRCIGKYVHDKALTEKQDISLDTLSGIKHIRLHLKDKEVETVTVDMGTPACRFQEREIEAGGLRFKGTAVSMGNPHLVIFVEDISRIDLPVVGSLLEHHEWFPQRVNVEFAEVTGKDTIRMRVWERGSGITQACGTGACATAVAAALTGRCGRRSDVVMDGGTLGIAWDEQSGRVYMTGGATTVFEGVIQMEN